MQHSTLETQDSDSQGESSRTDRLSRHLMLNESQPKCTLLVEDFQSMDAMCSSCSQAVGTHARRELGYSFLCPAVARMIDTVVHGMKLGLDEANERGHARERKRKAAAAAAAEEIFRNRYRDRTSQDFEERDAAEMTEVDAPEMAEVEPIRGSWWRR